jgi:sortase B
LRKKLIKTIWILSFTLCLLIFVTSAFEIYSYCADYNAAKESYDEAQQSVQIGPPVQRPKPTVTVPPTTVGGEVEDNTGPTVPETTVPETTVPEATLPTEPEPETEINPLHINMSIDWATLKAESKGLIGWIYIPDTNISYPLVQWSDNDYYLERDYKGKWTANGSIFLDWKQSLQSDNMFVYGHNMKADIMFHRLRNYYKQDYADAHKYIYIATEESIKIYQVFSVVRVDKTSDTYTYKFDDNMTFNEYVKQEIDKSMVATELKDIPEGTQLLALSTCTGRYKAERWVVHAAMIDEYTCTN